MKKQIETLTASEAKTFNSLVRLGDNEALALDTVIKARAKADNSEFYRNAYEN